MATINKEFIITFQPKDPAAHNGKRRFSVGALSLGKYIGNKNAETAISAALERGEDKFRKKFRAHGLVDFYAR